MLGFVAGRGGVAWGIVEDWAVDFDLDSVARRVTTVAQNTENRASYRYPVLPGNSSAKIIIGDVTHVGHLTEESAGGFTLEVNEDVPLEVNQTIILRCHSGWFSCQVRHLTALEHCRRVGLKRLKILPPPEDESPSTSRGGSWFNYSQVALFGLCMIGGGIATLSLTQPTWLSDWISGRVNESTLSRTAINTEFSSKVPDLRTTRILEGFNSLTNPKVAQALKLNGEQVRNINTAFTDASRDLSLLFARTGSQNNAVWQQESMSIVNTTLQRVLCVLNDDQIKAWRSQLTAKSP